MIIDCHGHYTTAPKGHDLFREQQIAHFNDPSLPRPVYPDISDDEIRETIEDNQLRLIRERGADMTIFSPRASTMAHPCRRRGRQPGMDGALQRPDCTRGAPLSGNVHRRLPAAAVTGCLDRTVDR